MYKAIITSAQGGGRTRREGGRGVRLLVVEAVQGGRMRRRKCKAKEQNHEVEDEKQRKMC